MITADKNNTRFLLTNSKFSYAFELAEEGFPVHLYWGTPLRSAIDLPCVHDIHHYRFHGIERTGYFNKEFTVFGGKFFDESALKISYPDGNRASFFRFSGSKQENDTLYLEFKEENHPIVVTLVYRLSETLLERYFTITNNGTQDVELENFESAVWQMSGKNTEWRATHLYGHWGKEAMIARQMLSPGKFVIESRTGLTGPFHVPFFALDDGSATELNGDVYFGTILWSGNWKIQFEVNPFGNTAVLGGINNFDSRISLHPGETFETPTFAAGYSAEGFSGMSRILHRWEDDVLLPEGVAHKELPMLTNTWGSLNINVNEENILSLAEKAAKIGSELFVIDDGWQSALGDWDADPLKFPNGLRPVVEKVAKLGMKFGLWIEPESFELKSKLYAKHPDWAMCYPGSKPDIKCRADVDRTSIMLNLAKKEVAEYLYNVIHKLVAETGVSYLKLDMNCYFTSPGGSERLWIDYAKNLDWIFQKLTTDYPSLLLENCAAGSARPSLQMTKSFGRMNRSDNQDTLDILRLHEGFTYMNLPRMAGGACHISDSIFGMNNRKTTLKFQAYAGMLGSLACGKNLLKCTDAELDDIRFYTDLYKNKIRPVVHHGELYRLASITEHSYAAYEYVLRDKSEAVVFIFGTSQQFADKLPRFFIPGLEENTVYDIVCYGDEIQPGTHETSRVNCYPMTGRGFAEVGVQIELTGDYDCRILHITKQK